MATRAVRQVMSCLAIFMSISLGAAACGSTSSSIDERTAFEAGSGARQAATDVPPPSAPAIGQRVATLDQLSVETSVAPVAVRVEGVDVGGPVVAVSADSTSGDLAVPPSADTVAWYEHGPSPGQPGTAVLAAHVDWQGKRGAFFSLNTIPVGATIVVTLADGSEIPFTVMGSEQIAKDDLPRDDIFSRDGQPQLVLVTCGGSFDSDEHHYADNVIVFAVPT